jgi:DNA-binding NarL/FixJ family response regulator
MVQWRGGDFCGERNELVKHFRDATRAMHFSMGRLLLHAKVGQLDRFSSAFCNVQQAMTKSRSALEVLESHEAKHECCYTERVNRTENPLRDFGLHQASKTTAPSSKLATTPGAHEHLTARERQVLHLIIEGKSTKQIANELGMSFKTAACHRSHILQKLDVHETASLVRIALHNGL